MNIEEIREYCLAKPNVTEGFPFGETVLVFKVNNKMFCLLALDEHPHSFNVKCNPEIIEDIRAEFESVLPGYHMNKKHWNTVLVDGKIGKKQLQKFIDWSYDLVEKKPNKKVKN
jgi:predicted DNA-binding protein (MmcQ/YjbR family)